MFATRYRERTYIFANGYGGISRPSWQCRDGVPGFSLLSLGDGAPMSSAG